LVVATDVVEAVVTGIVDVAGTADAVGAVEAAVKCC
jgi:hypothetical protein